MGNLTQDIRYAIRMLAKNPSFTVVAVLTLALGIGANTAIFSVVYPVLLKPLAMENPSRVADIPEQWPRIVSNMSARNFEDIQRESKSFAKLCASNGANFNIATADAPE